MLTAMQALHLAKLLHGTPLSDQLRMHAFRSICDALQKASEQPAAAHLMEPGHEVSVPEGQQRQALGSQLLLAAQGELVMSNLCGLGNRQHL